MSLGVRGRAPRLERVGSTRLRILSMVLVALSLAGMVWSRLAYWQVVEHGRLAILSLRLHRKLAVLHDLPVRKTRPHRAGKAQGDQHHREDPHARGANTLNAWGPGADPDRHYRVAASTSRVPPTVLMTAATARAHNGVASPAEAPTGAVRSIATGWPAT